MLCKRYLSEHTTLHLAAGLWKVCATLLGICFSVLSNQMLPVRLGLSPRLQCSSYWALTQAGSVFPFLVFQGFCPGPGYGPGLTSMSV